MPKSSKKESTISLVSCATMLLLSAVDKNESLFSAAMLILASFTDDTGAESTETRNQPQFQEHFEFVRLPKIPEMYTSNSKQLRKINLILLKMGNSLKAFTHRIKILNSAHLC